MKAALIAFTAAALYSTSQSAGGAEPARPAPDRHVLIVCGHPGDDEHKAAFLETVDKIVASLRDHWGIAPDRLRVLFGQGEGEYPAADRESIAAEAARLAEAAEPDDAVWVIVIGHAHYDGRNSWLNLPGDDVEQIAFAAFFRDLKAKEQVFVLTFPVSGFHIRPLAREGRVVIAATEPDLEINETIYPAGLAEALAIPPAELDDADADGRRTLLDFYVAVARKVADLYTADEAIPTEHAQLDDDGDGRGTEFQRDYLPAEQGGRFTGTPPARRSTGDGVRSAEVLLPAGIAGTGVTAREPAVAEKPAAASPVAP